MLARFDVFLLFVSVFVLLKCPVNSTQPELKVIYAQGNPSTSYKCIKLVTVENDAAYVYNHPKPFENVSVSFEPTATNYQSIEHQLLKELLTPCRCRLTSSSTESQPSNSIFFDRFALLQKIFEVFDLSDIVFSKHFSFKI